MQEKRSKGQRRWGIAAEFPIIDSNGIAVVIDRRRIRDRRLDNIPMAERLMLFAQMLPPHPDRK
ncbi:MAG: hypothetical protein OEN52_04800 [Gammaproteobacteria bacterium]|nr:hypothetical protein [Gammaproteobacteria bacterium]MDH3560255.1 hypothetical protein [Gammaproteobacteria bacterium]